MTSEEENVRHGTKFFVMFRFYPGKTAAFMLPILERLLFKPKQSPVTRILVLVPTRELAIQVIWRGFQLKFQFVNVETTDKEITQDVNEDYLRGSL